MLASVPALVLFVLLTWQVTTGGPLRTADEHLAVSMRRDAPPLAEPFADLGNMPVALPVLAFAMAWSLLRTRRWGPVLCHATAMAAVPAVVSALKACIDRPGPLYGIGYYPSGHATTAAVAFGGAALLLADGRWRALFPLAVSAAAVLTLLNGMGLVWRGYHWPADVLASWCLGWLLLTTAAAAARRTDGGYAPKGGRRCQPFD